MAKPIKKAKVNEMRSRVVIESLVETPDGQGGFSQAYVTFATVWAKIETWKRDERWFGEQVQPIGDHRITIRWIDGLAETMRVRYETSFITRLFQIHGIQFLDERRFQVALTCEENKGS